MDDIFAHSTPGGRVDTPSRVVAELLPKTIGQTVVVDKRPVRSGNMTRLAAWIGPDSARAISVKVIIQ